MITNSVPSSSETTQKTITQSINVKITKCIIQWQAKPAEHYPEIGTNCHCLLRIYDFEVENRAVVIASSLWSNHGNRGIGSDPDSLATAVVSKFPHLKPILSNSTWIAHSGQFSYEITWAETFHRERFREMSVALDDEYKLVVDELEIVKKERVIALLNQLPLEPATVVLKQLEHDNGWGGVVDEEQIKACWELENGIVLGEVRNTGLVGW